jgi:rhamnogalacturonyl hydrolase YesR
MKWNKMVEWALNCRQKFNIFWKYPELFYFSNGKISNRLSLKLAMEWLCRAQDTTGNGGVSASYDLNTGKWGNPYRETTGYIISTFLNYSKLVNDKTYKDRAVKMGDWLVSDQLADGSYGEVSEGDHSTKPILTKKVFNTAQIILGLCALADETGETKYIDTAIKSANWLVSIQNGDGSWTQHTTQGERTYHSRVDWALLEVYKRTKNIKFRNCAKANINWVLDQQLENGWFKNCSLSVANKPWTHLIAYTIRGLLESAEILKSKKIFRAAKLAADANLNSYIKEKKPYLLGTYDDNWQSLDSYSCLTGNTQMAIIWLKLFYKTKDKRYRQVAREMMEFNKSCQINNSTKLGLLGGVAGSYPIDGDYCSYLVLNWATKFFADTIMLEFDSKIKISA